MSPESAAVKLLAGVLAGGIFLGIVTVAALLTMRREEPVDVPVEKRPPRDEREDHEDAP